MAKEETVGITILMVLQVKILPSIFLMILRQGQPGAGAEVGGKMILRQMEHIVKEEVREEEKVVLLKLLRLLELLAAEDGDVVEEVQEDIPPVVELVEMELYIFDLKYKGKDKYAKLLYCKQRHSNYREYNCV